MEEEQLAELGQYFDEYMFGDPTKPQTQQAIFCFKSIARDVYACESQELKDKIAFERYIALVVIPEVVAFLDKRQAKHPVLTPEKAPPKR